MPTKLRKLLLLIVIALISTTALVGAERGKDCIFNDKDSDICGIKFGKESGNTIVFYSVNQKTNIDVFLKKPSTGAVFLFAIKILNSDATKLNQQPNLELIGSGIFTKSKRSKIANVEFKSSGIYKVFAAFYSTTEQGDPLGARSVSFWERNLANALVDGSVIVCNPGDNGCTSIERFLSSRRSNLLTLTYGDQVPYLIDLKAYLQKTVKEFPKYSLSDKEKYAGYVSDFFVKAYSAARPNSKSIIGVEESKIKSRIMAETINADKKQKVRNFLLVLRTSYSRRPVFESDFRQFQPIAKSDLATFLFKYFANKNVPMSFDSALAAFKKYKNDLIREFAQKSEKEISTSRDSLRRLGMTLKYEVSRGSGKITFVGSPTQVKQVQLEFVAPYEVVYNIINPSKIEVVLSQDLCQRVIEANQNRIFREEQRVGFISSQVVADICALFIPHQRELEVLGEIDNLVRNDEVIAGFKKFVGTNYASADKFALEYIGLYGKLLEESFSLKDKDDANYVLSALNAEVSYLGSLKSVSNFASDNFRQTMQERISVLTDEEVEKKCIESIKSNWKLLLVFAAALPLLAPIEGFLFIAGFALDIGSIGYSIFAFAQTGEKNFGVCDALLTGFGYIFDIGKIAKGNEWFTVALKAKSNQAYSRVTRAISSLESSKYVQKAIKEFETIKSATKAEKYNAVLGLDNFRSSISDVLKTNINLQSPGRIGFDLEPFNCAQFFCGRSTGDLGGVFGNFKSFVSDQLNSIINRDSVKDFYRRGQHLAGEQTLFAFKKNAKIDSKLFSDDDVQKFLSVFGENSEAAVATFNSLKSSGLKEQDILAFLNARKPLDRQAFLSLSSALNRIKDQKLKPPFLEWVNFIAGAGVDTLKYTDKVENSEFSVVARAVIYLDYYAKLSTPQAFTDYNVIFEKLAKIQTQVSLTDLRTLSSFNNYENSVEIWRAIKDTNLQGNELALAIKGALQQTSLENLLSLFSKPNISQKPVPKQVIDLPQTPKEVPSVPAPKVLEQVSTLKVTDVSPSLLDTISKATTSRRLNIDKQLPVIELPLDRPLTSSNWLRVGIDFKSGNKLLVNLNEEVLVSSRPLSGLDNIFKASLQNFEDASTTLHIYSKDADLALFSYEHVSNVYNAISSLDGMLTSFFGLIAKGEIAGHTEQSILANRFEFAKSDSRFQQLAKFLQALGLQIDFSEPVKFRSSLQNSRESLNYLLNGFERDIAQGNIDFAKDMKLILNDRASVSVRQKLGECLVRACSRDRNSIRDIINIYERLIDPARQPILSESQIEILSQKLLYLLENNVNPLPFMRGEVFVAGDEFYNGVFPELILYYFRGLKKDGQLADSLRFSSTSSEINSATSVLKAAYTNLRGAASAFQQRNLGNLNVLKVFERFSADERFALLQSIATFKPFEADDVEKNLQLAIIIDSIANAPTISGKTALDIVSLSGEFSRKPGDSFKVFYTSACRKLGRCLDAFVLSAVPKSTRFSEEDMIKKPFGIRMQTSSGDFVVTDSARTRYIENRIQNALSLGNPLYIASIPEDGRSMSNAIFNLADLLHVKENPYDVNILGDNIAPQLVLSGSESLSKAFPELEKVFSGPHLKGDELNSEFFFDKQPDELRFNQKYIQTRASGEDLDYGALTEKLKALEYLSPDGRLRGVISKLKVDVFLPHITRNLEDFSEGRIDFQALVTEVQKVYDESSEFYDQISINGLTLAEGMRIKTTDNHFDDRANRGLKETLEKGITDLRALMEAEPKGQPNPQLLNEKLKAIATRLGSYTSTGSSRKTNEQMSLGFVGTIHFWTLDPKKSVRANIKDNYDLAEAKFQIAVKKQSADSSYGFDSFQVVHFINPKFADLPSLVSVKLSQDQNSRLFAFGLSATKYLNDVYSPSVTDNLLFGVGEAVKAGLLAFGPEFGSSLVKEGRDFGIMLTGAETRSLAQRIRSNKDSLTKLSVLRNNYLSKLNKPTSDVSPLNDEEVIHWFIKSRIADYVDSAKFRLNSQEFSYGEIFRRGSQPNDPILLSVVDPFPSYYLALADFSAYVKQAKKPESFVNEFLYLQAQKNVDNLVKGSARDYMNFHIASKGRVGLTGSSGISTSQLSQMVRRNNLKQSISK